MKCPKCSAPITAKPDAQGYLICAGCGARLRSRAAAQAATAGAAPPAAPAAPPVPAPPPPPKAAAPAPPPSAPTPLAFPAPAEAPASLAQVFAELRAVRQTQQEILALLRGRPAASPVPASLPPHAAHGFGGATGFEASAEEPDPDPRPRPAPARSRRRVILLDDDAATREAAKESLRSRGLEVVATETGKQAIAAIGESKPDAIVMEIGIEGDMPGRDFVNIVKATMDWVDIPLVLFTRVPVADEEEARTLHGADLYVQKGPGAEAALAERLAGVLGR
jgi:CheY-like chemotaxis protein